MVKLLDDQPGATFRQHVGRGDDAIEHCDGIGLAAPQIHHEVITTPVFHPSLDQGQDITTT